MLDSSQEPNVLEMYMIKVTKEITYSENFEEWLKEKKDEFIKDN